MPNPKTEKYGTDIVAYKASELWSTLPTRCKKLPSLDLFKCKIESWTCSDCPCNICWNFVDGVGFVNKIKGNFSNVSFLRLEILKILMLLTKGFYFFELKIYVHLILSSFKIVTWSSWTTFLLSLSKLITEQIGADRRPSLLFCSLSSKSLQLINMDSEKSDRKALANVESSTSGQSDEKKV